MSSSPRTSHGAATLFAVALAGAWAATAPPARAQHLDVKEIDLDNGMKVLLCRRPGDPNVAAGWTAKVGSVNERPGITGISHLFEHMMFKGTHVIGVKPGKIAEDLANNAEQDRVRAEMRKEQEALDNSFRLGLIPDPNDPKARSEKHRQLRQQLDDLMKKQKDLLVDNEFDQRYKAAGGSGLNAFTTFDETVYFVTLPANKLELWFWLESDRLAQPVFRQFYSERDVVWEERRMRTDSTPTGRLDEQFDALFWQASPYGWPVIGWPSDLDAITREDALAYFGRNYSPNNVTAAIVGDFEPAEAEALARRYFGRLVRSKLEPTAVRTVEPEQLAMRRLEGEADTRPTVRVRYHTVREDHADDAALHVLAEILNGQTGRLNKRIVEDQKIATTASARQESRRYEGLFEMSGVAAEGHSPEDVEQALHAELKRLQDEPVDDRELKKVQNGVVADNYRQLSTNFAVLLQLLINEALGTWEDVNTDAAKLLAVTPADVQRVARKYFPDSGRTVAIYRTRKAATRDTAWDAFDEKQQAVATRIKAQVDGTTDEAKLRSTLDRMTAAKADAPPEVQAVLTWAEGYIRARIDSMKGGAQ